MWVVVIASDISTRILASRRTLSPGFWRHIIFVRICLILLLMDCACVSAAVLTVGPGGGYPTIQAAVDAAVANPGNDEIRIADGIYNENLGITPNGAGGKILISGGWDGSFSAQISSSVVDGGGSGRVAEVSLKSGDQLSLERLVFQNGLADRGAGLLAYLSGDSVLQVYQCRITDNIADSLRSVGGGLRVRPEDTSQFELVDSVVVDNQAICSGTIDCRGGGMAVQAADDAQIRVLGTRISGNSVTIADGSGLVGGADISLFDDASLEFNDNYVMGNHVSAKQSGGAGIGLQISGSGPQIVRRNRVWQNEGDLTVGSSQFVAQMGVAQWGSATSVVSDTLISDSSGAGLYAGVSGHGIPVMHLVNLTVVNNGGIGIRFDNSADNTATADMSNSIAVNNGTNDMLDPSLVMSHNLFGSSAGFVDAAGGNYRLTGNSPAVDAGDNSPPGGLGPRDLDGNLRILNGSVDIGAYELPDAIFANGFD